MTLQSPIISASAIRSNGPSTISSLQLGEGWFTERGGGLNRYFAELLAHLPEAGVRSRGLVVGAPAVAESTGGNVRSVAPVDAGLRARLAAMRKAANQEIAIARPDLVVGHFAPYVWPTLRTIRGIPLAIHFHGPWAAESRAEGGGRIPAYLKFSVERAVYRSAHRLIVLSEAFRDILCRDYGVAAERVRVIPGGVDVERFNVILSRAQARTELGWPVDRPIILAVRRLVHRMGIENLIDAAECLIRTHPDAQIFIAGAGPLAETLRQRIIAKDLAKNVRLLGFVPDERLPLAYRAADLTVVPSIALEGFGLVAAESLASGTPALVTAVGGLPDVVRSLSPDLVLKSGEPSLMAAALAGFLGGGPALPTETECREYAKARFDWRQIAARVADVYRDAVA